MQEDYSLDALLNEFVYCLKEETPSETTLQGYGAGLKKLLVNEFESYLLKERKLEKITSKFYRADLERVLPGDVYQQLLTEKRNEIKTAQDYYRFLVEKISERVKSIDEWDKHSKPATKNSRIEAAKTFLKFLKKKGRIEEVPPYELKKVEKRPYTTIIDKQFEKFMEVIPFDEYINARDRAIFSLMDCNGIRSSEIVNLTSKNFKEEDGRTYVYILGKYGRRRAEINENTVEELNTYKFWYYEARKAKNLSSLESGSFFREQGGEGISTRSIRRKCEKWAEIAGLEVEPRNLIHSYAQRKIAEGADKNRLAELMGITPGGAYQLIRALPKA